MKKIPEEKDISDVEESETEDGVKEEMEEGELEGDIYTIEGAEELEENDEIDELEEGFAEGYDEFKGGKCVNCEKVITDNPVEFKVGKEIYRFCSQRCAESFRKKKKI
ncbi:MAG: TRASH domain-containing protein [Nanoarchaeota archaeon]